MTGNNGINIWVRVIGVLIAATLVSVFIIKGDPELAKQNANKKVSTITDIAKEMVSSTGETILSAATSSDMGGEVVVAEEEVIEKAAEEIVTDKVEGVMGDALDAVAPKVDDVAEIVEAELGENIEPASEVISDMEAQEEQVAPSADDAPVNEAPVGKNDE